MNETESDVTMCYGFWTKYNEIKTTERVTIVDINSVTVTAPSSFVVPGFNDIFLTSFELEFCEICSARTWGFAGNIRASENVNPH